MTLKVHYTCTHGDQVGWFCREYTLLSQALVCQMRCIMYQTPRPQARSVLVLLPKRLAQKKSKLVFRENKDLFLLWHTCSKWWFRWQQLACMTICRAFDTTYMWWVAFSVTTFSTVWTQFLVTFVKCREMFGLVRACCCHCPRVEKGVMLISYQPPWPLQIYRCLQGSCSDWYRQRGLFVCQGH